jgi:hypothetical protein
MTSNLTPLQQGLVNDLIKEFTNINPKPKAEGSKRFTLETIDECNREEQRFKDTITKHNLTMMKVFTNQFNEELKEFKKEFGKVLTTQIGHDRYGKPHATLDILSEMTKEKPLANNEYYEMNLFIVSKTKSYSGSDSRENYCDNMRYLQLYVDFKRERVVHKLESDKEVVVYKIVGLEYRRTFSYLHRDKTLNTSTLDELIQQSKDVQKIFVELVG